MYESEDACLGYCVILATNYICIVLSSIKMNARKKLFFINFVSFQEEQIDLTCEDSGLEQRVSYFVNLHILQTIY